MFKIKLFINASGKWVKSVNPVYGFLFFLLILALLYDYPSILLKRPQSTHHWRQSDCTSITLNYYQGGMHFFQPQTHGLVSDGKTTGYNATSEIPIGYYFIALLYKIFGYHDFIYRLVNTLIFLTGLFFLFRTIFLWLQNFFWSATITLFFFTSPVLVYYGNNFLTDTSALSFALIAWYFFSKFYLTGKQKAFYVSMFFFFLAGAYKITGLISFVAIGALFFIELTGLIKFRGNERLFRKPVFQIIPFIIIIIIIGSWTLYADHYNKIHATAYFSTGIFPIWDLDANAISYELHVIHELWLNQYFNIWALYLLGTIFLLNLVFIKKENKFLISTSLLLFLGTILYCVLWFQTFQNHDYYTINLYILLILTFISFVWLMNTHFPRLFKSVYLKVVFFIFLVFNVAHAKEQIRGRYYGWWNEYPEYKDYHTITPYLRSIGIAPLDTVICLPDETHFTLYLMNQRGWTRCMGANRDSAGIETSIKHGAKYLIVNGNEIINRKYMQYFLRNQVGSYNDVRIYKLNKGDSCKSYTPIEKKVTWLRCGAERVSPEGKYFLADSSNIQLEGVCAQSAEKVFSGKYSVKLSKDCPYSMTYRFKDIEPGEHFTISVYRFTSNGNGVLIASANNGKEFYLTQSKAIEKLSNGWEKLSLEFYINFKPSDGEIAVYLWNQAETPVYFDDLAITRSIEKK